MSLLHSRRQFIVQAPLGLLGAAAALGDANRRPEHDPRLTGADWDLSKPAPTPPLPLFRPTGGEPVLRWIPKHEELVYTFGGAAPRQRVQPGTRIITWTEDCFDGTVKTAADLASKVMTPGHDNPQTGPFYVEGAAPGDTLAIHITKLEPARTFGISNFSPGFGALVGTDRTAMLGAELPETTWRYDLNADKTAAHSTSADGKFTWSVPLAPFLGCLGVAPALGEARSTLVPDTFGGNMDCPEVRAGNTVFLGVNVPGALVSFGDAHYAMGEGEIIGAAIEGAMNVEVVVDVIKGKYAPVPRIENADEVMFVGSGRPLEDAARMAFKEMVAWVRGATNLSELDAYQFVSQNAKAPIIELVDPQYTVLVKIEKKRLPTSPRS